LVINTGYAIAVSCKYVEVCERGEEFRVGDEGFCILHVPPGPSKNLLAFQEALAAHLNGGRCDFRWIYFPEAMGAPTFDGQHFSRTVDFRDATIPHPLTDLLPENCSTWNESRVG
jgi:hypothetical protein